MLNTALFKRRMLEKNLTQEDLAKKVNMDQATLSLKLNNQRAMKLSEAEALQSALEISDADFRAYFFSTTSCIVQQ